MDMSDDGPATGDWFERTLFGIGLVVFLFLAATGPWLAGGPAGDGSCPVTANERYVPADSIEEADHLERGVLFVTERPAHTSDWQCISRTLSSGESVEVGNVELSIDDDGTVRADGDVVGEEQTWISRGQRVSVTDLWYTYHNDLILYNAGPIDGIRTAQETRDVDREVVLVTGTLSTTAQLNLLVVGIFVAATLVVIGIALEWSVRYAGVDFSDGDADDTGSESDGE